MPANQKKLQFTLGANDVGQLLDGLRLRAEAWTKTGDYLESRLNPDDQFICEECSGSSEARRIAQHYEHIIAQIEYQIERQGGRV